MNIAVAQRTRTQRTCLVCFAIKDVSILTNAQLNKNADDILSDFGRQFEVRTGKSFCI